MAAPTDVELIPNEYYEMKEVADKKSHPYRLLTDFKIVMVAETTVDSVVFKWPSFESLAFFFNDYLDVLPTLDEECTLWKFEASSIVKCRIDPVELCLYRGSLPQTWLHDHAMIYLRVASSTITATHTDHTQRNRIRTDQFYALNCVDLPRDIAFALARTGGLPQVAWVSRQIEGQNVGPTVEVRVPSMASLVEFEGSESLALPNFNQVFIISSESARSCLLRIIPLRLCFQLRKRRDFWFIEHQGQTSHAGAGVGVDAHDAGARAGVSGADH